MMDTDLAITTIARVLVHSVWQGPVVLLGNLVCRRVLGQNHARWRYRAAVVAQVVLVCLPILTWLLTRTMASLTPVATAGAAGILSPPGVVSDWARQLDLRLTPDLATVALAVWAAGVAVALARIGLGWLRLTRLLSHVGSVVELPGLTRLARCVGLTRPPRVVQTSRAGSPFVAGWRRPVLVLPIGLCQALTRGERDAVLLHELAHLRRHDLRNNLVLRLLGALAWHQLPLRVLSRQLQREREHCCDELALAAAGRPLLLARALVSLEAHRSCAPGLVMAGTGVAHGTRGDFGRRIRRILAWQGPAATEPAPMRTALAASVLALLCGSAALAAGAAESASLAEAGRMHAVIQAHDPAGPFTVELVGRKLVAATIGGESVPADRIVQAGNTVRLLDPGGQPELTLEVRLRGGIHWTPRPPRSP
jgi:beta-lactamase regulating signal transducer with metallopeptidase domain